jgi:hypothetical protein
MTDSDTIDRAEPMAQQRHANDYYFLDKWFIPAPIDKVWAYISNSKSYPQWWGMAWENVTPLNDVPPGGVGAKVSIIAKGVLPYKVKLTIETVRVEKPHTLGVIASGDLNGSGLWQLKEVDGGTAVSYEWIVRADKPIIRYLSPIVKPVFEYNHRWVMRHGEEALRKVLAGA